MNHGSASTVTQLPYTVYLINVIFDLFFPRLTYACIHTHYTITILTNHPIPFLKHIMSLALTSLRAITHASLIGAPALSMGASKFNRAIAHTLRHSSSSAAVQQKAPKAATMLVPLVVHQTQQHRYRRIHISVQPLYRQRPRALVEAAWKTGYRAGQDDGSKYWRIFCEMFGRLLSLLFQTSFTSSLILLTSEVVANSAYSVCKRSCFRKRVVRYNVERVSLQYSMVYWWC